MLVKPVWNKVKEEGNRLQCGAKRQLDTSKIDASQTLEVPHHPYFVSKHDYVWNLAHLKINLACGC